MVEASLGGVKALLLCPHTFMNLSGGSVLAARDFYKLTNDDVLVVCDDFNLPLAKLRFRASGSAGGQKGLADILRRLGTRSSSAAADRRGSAASRLGRGRFRIGKIQQSRTTEVEIAVVEAADAVVDWAVDGIANCMNRYN